VGCDLSLALTNDSRQLRLYKSLARFLSTPVDDWPGQYDPWINAKDVGGQGNLQDPNYLSVMTSSVVGPEFVLPSCALRTGQNPTTTRSKNARIKSNQVRSADAQNLPAPSIGQVPTTLRSGAISLTTACHAFLEELSTELTFSNTPLCVSTGIQETLRVLAPFAVSTVT
jgi:hypothetical protein